jgi:murein DD-endopeptidase MepM/ murein hydrolase activator NlpD
MEIIFISKAHRAGRRLHLGALSALALSALVLSVGGGLAWAGYRAGLAAHTDDAERALHHAMDSQREVVHQAIRDAQNDLDALALRLGDMQAHVIRLDALGARLVEMANLDQEEFSFELPPGRGGPAELGTSQPQTQADFLAQLEQLAAQLDDREVKLKALENLLMEGSLQARVHPAGRPVTEGWISSYFGYRNDPITGRRAFHEGIDFAGKLGEDVRAVAAGVVVWSGYKHGYGNLVEIRHANGYSTRYGHNKKILVRAGETVQKGQRIALMGSTGRSTGPHVHFEVLHNGKRVNPLKFVRAD